MPFATPAPRVVEGLGMRRFLCAVFIMAGLAGTSAAAAPITIDFSGYLARTFTRPLDPGLSTAFTVGTPMSGSFVYEAGAAIGAPSTFSNPSFSVTFRRAAGAEVLKSGQVTIGSGASGTTIRYEGLDPSVPSPWAETFAQNATHVTLSEGRNAASNAGDEQLTFGLGTGVTFADGTSLRSSIFSETNDRTGAYQPTNMALGFVNQGSLGSTGRPFDRVGIVDLDELPLDFDELVATAESRHLSLNFVDGSRFGNLQFVITDVSFSAAAADVPEPAALGLLGLAIAWLAFGRRRRC
jgi:hypothetical protein